MKAVILNGTGGREKLEFSTSYPVPKPTDGQVIVNNTFVGFNFIDIYLRTGFYPSTTGYPLILGQEGAGTVVAIEGSNPLDFRPGDRWQAVRIPENVSDEDAVASHMAGMTALSLVKEAYPAKRGDTVLVHAAAGGVGSFLCQLLSNEGVIVIATSGGPNKCALAKENGATHAIDYKDPSGRPWVEQVLELTGGDGVDAAYDSVGKDTWEDSIEVTKRKGRVVYFGSASGPVPPLNLALIRAKNATVIQPTLSNYITTRQELEYYAHGVLERVQDGRLKVKTSRVYSWAEVAQAHKDLEERRSTGKLLLKL
ncbi:NADPH2:quinone reductase [Dactylonectria macrodidyma]|uniref:Probable quinone oxidoreductase n=1 Tax=Dactylonectria macrodidyma TaxID=307937 RepID=A0A9P9I7F9_9HYPO|nr:NADPH2:quinone reductase [Dactylonectria macrodidyma]